MISDRPAEVEDRAVPGHWAGDLIIGKNADSAVGTLVERSTRYVMLLHLPDGRFPAQVDAAMRRAIKKLPQELLRTITWDQGKEMHRHLQFNLDTGIQIYFLRPPQPLATGFKRKYERAAAPIHAPWSGSLGSQCQGPRPHRP